MSISKKELHELIDQLPDNKTESVILFLKQLVLKPEKEKINPDEYWGIIKDTGINVEEECRKLREEWDRDIY